VFYSLTEAGAELLDRVLKAIAVSQTAIEGLQ
jgi:DNA-binding PadR family transcriptional regulator